MLTCDLPIHSMTPNIHEQADGAFRELLLHVGPGDQNDRKRVARVGEEPGEVRGHAADAKSDCRRRGSLQQCGSWCRAERHPSLTHDYVALATPLYAHLP